MQHLWALKQFHQGEPGGRGWDDFRCSPLSHCLPITMLLEASLLPHAWGAIQFLKKDFGMGPGLSEVLPLNVKPVDPVSEPHDICSACPAGSQSSARDARKP